MSHLSLSPRGHRAWRWLLLFCMTVAGALGALIAGLGIRIVLLGGTLYYVLAGTLLLAGGVLAWFRRETAAVWLVLAAVALTLAWSLLEIHGKGWMPAWGFDLAARMGVLTALAVGAAVALLFWRTPPGHRWRKVCAAGLALALVAAALPVALMWERVQGPAAGHALAATDPDQPGTQEGAAAGEWTAFGGTNRGLRYSTLAQIHLGNVDGLQEAWTFRTDDHTPAEGRVFYSSQNTPLKVGDYLYTCTASSQVFALDPATGEALWHFDPQVPAGAMESLFSAACRTVAYFDEDDAAPVVRFPHTPDAVGLVNALPRDGSQCSRKVYVATPDGRLIALDAAGGFPCPEFGNEGVVDLNAGMGLRETGFASNTSGATVAAGLLILGQQVSDNQRRDAPSGVVRAFDARSGELRWAWDALRADPTAPLAPGEIYPRGTPNVWNVISADESLGLAFLGTGNPGADHWGGNRTPEEDRFTAAIVAVDLETGATRWSFNTVIHDLWDYDIGAQPMLVDVPIDGAMRRAVLQGTKTGDLFLLDAANGEPLRPVTLQPTPQTSPLPGEWLSPHQPRSQFYPSLAGLPGRESERIDGRHVWGLTPVDAALCRIQFHERAYEGMFTPPTIEKKGMVLLPGTMGGMNWGGLGFDPVRRIVIANYSRLPNIVDMHPREDVVDRPVGSGGARPDQAVAPQTGTPFGVDRPMWLSALNVPCLAPPWGFIAAIHIDTGELVWSRPLGTGFDSGPLGIPTRIRVPMGTANLGGPLVTAGGLTFIAAAQDNFLRAFETDTGRLVWQARLPAGGQAGPMTYEHDGTQYIAITATGHARLETGQGDYLKVFALDPDSPDLAGLPPGPATRAGGSDAEDEGP